MMAFHVPQTSSEDYYALSLLESILSSGNTSRLYSALVDERQLAVWISTDYSHAFDPYIFSIFGVCSKGVSPSLLENSIIAELEKIVKDGVKAEELQKVKNQKLMF